MGNDKGFRPKLKKTAPPGRLGFKRSRLQTGENTQRFWRWPPTFRKSCVALVLSGVNGLARNQLDQKAASVREWFTLPPFSVIRSQAAIVTQLPFYNYVPLKIRFNDGGIQPNEVFGSIWDHEPGDQEGRAISLFVTNHGEVRCGTDEQPNSPRIFVNSSVKAFWEFIEAHKRFINLTIDECQLNGSEEFESTFVNNIYQLVIAFRTIDTRALDCRDYWWPMTIDSTLRKYREIVG